MISSCRRYINRSAIFITLENISAGILSSFFIVTLRLGAVTVVAVTEATTATMRAFDSFTISSYRRLASISTTAISALSLQQMSLKITLIYLAIIVNSICKVVINSEIEKHVPLFRSLLRSIVSS